MAGNGRRQEMVARALQAVASRRGPFIPVDCGAITESLMESELFVCEGPSRAPRGLAEVSSRRRTAGRSSWMRLAMWDRRCQSQLLRVLQEGEIHRVAGSVPVVDARVVAATNKDLRQVAEGVFRETCTGWTWCTCTCRPCASGARGHPALVQRAGQHARGGVSPVVTSEAMSRLTA